LNSSGAKKGEGPRAKSQHRKRYLASERTWTVDASCITATCGESRIVARCWSACQARGLQPTDSSDAYQENWRLALSDVLSSRSADYDFLELLWATGAAHHTYNRVNALSRALGRFSSRGHRDGKAMKLSWPSLSRFYRVRRIYGRRRRSISASVFSRCSSQMVWRSTAKGSIEPPQPHHFSAVYGRLMARIQGWWARVESNHRPLACEANALPLSHAP
jgi:hypothetical protein